MFLCVVWSMKLRLIVMPTNLKYSERRRKTEKTESRATGQRCSTRERTRARDKKSKGNIFCWRNNMKFCCSGEKMRNACFHQSKHEQREKQKKHWTSIRTRRLGWKLFYTMLKNNNKTCLLKFSNHICNFCPAKINEAQQWIIHFFCFIPPSVVANIKIGLFYPSSPYFAVAVSFKPFLNIFKPSLNLVA